MGKLYFFDEHSRELHGNRTEEAQRAQWIKQGREIVILALQKTEVGDDTERRTAENIAGLTAMVACSQLKLHDTITVGDSALQQDIFQRGWLESLGKLRAEYEIETGETPAARVFAAAWNMCQEITAQTPPNKSA